MASSVHAIGLGLRDLIAPPRCMGCLREGVWLCTNCRHHLPPTVARCIGCNQQSARGLTCPSCRSHYTLSGVVSAGPYHHPVFKRGIRWLKFKGVRPLSTEIASTLLPRLTFIAPIQELSQHAILAPIPLHNTHQRMRGFNQSEDIARAISRFSNIPAGNLLIRTKHTRTQSQLPHHLRSQNLAGAFAVQKNHLSGLQPETRIIILVDDVATTGATLESAARTLRGHFPHSIRIWAMTVARG